MVLKVCNYSKIMIAHIKNNRPLQVLLVILLIGAALRYYGLHHVESPDENNEVFEALRVASGKFNLNRWHKKGYQNILAVEYGIYFAIGYVLNMFYNPMDFAAKIIRNMEPLFLIGRYTTATMGTLSVALIYMIGQRIYNSRIGLAAAVLLSVSTVHIWTSHLVGTDVPLTFFFLLSFYFICRFFDSGKLIDYSSAAFFGAVAINIKIIGVGIGIIFVSAHLLKCKKEKRRYIRYIYSKEVLYSLAAFIAGYIISNPAIILGLKQWIMSFIWQYGIYTNVYDDVPYMMGDNTYFIYLRLLNLEFGLPLSLLTMASLIYAVYKRDNWDYILITFIGAIFLVLSNTNFLVQNRYLMVVLPALYLLTGRFLDSFLNKFSISQRRQGAILSVVIILLSFYPLMNSLKYVITLTEENTSVTSKRWIESNISPGSKILIDAGRTVISSGPRLNQSREKLEEQLKVIRNLKDGETFDSPQVKIVDSYAAIYFEILLRNMPQTTYDITTTELGRNVESIDYYRENGFDYIIHDEGLNYRIKDPIWRKKYPISVEFYESLDKKLQLIKTFSPSRTRSGPIIKIYKVRNI